MDNAESLPVEATSDERRGGSRESDRAVTLEKQRKISLSREGLYSFLSRSLLYEVDTEFLTVIEAAQPAIEFFASSQEGEALRKASEELATISSKVAVVEGAERKQLLVDFDVEYASLFLGTGKGRGRAHVWPWESAYFTDPPRMYAGPYHEVCDAYRSVGYEKPKESKEPEDHIGLELDFMAHLCRLTTASIDNGNAEFALGYVRLQKEFMKDHLLRWAGKFSRRLLDTSERRETDFYHAIATMLESFLLLDDQAIDEITSNLQEMSAKQGGAESKAVGG
jgi:TorA maturation chaperone TorD